MPSHPSKNDFFPPFDPTDPRASRILWARQQILLRRYNKWRDLINTIAALQQIAADFQDELEDNWTQFYIDIGEYHDHHERSRV